MSECLGKLWHILYWHPFFAGNRFDYVIIFPCMNIIYIHVFIYVYIYNYLHIIIYIEYLYVYFYTYTHIHISNRCILLPFAVPVVLGASSAETS